LAIEFEVSSRPKVHVSDVGDSLTETATLVGEHHLHIALVGKQVHAQEV